MPEIKSENGQSHVRYEKLRDSLRWRCEGDALFKDGADHYLIDEDRFIRARCIIRNLIREATIYDVGSFPWYGLWAFRECGNYISVGKGPEWFKRALSLEPHVTLLDWDIESSEPPPTSPYPADVVLLQEVIEHVRQPKKFMEKLYAFMPSGSHLYMTTNNISYIGYILKLIASKEIFDSAMSEGTVYPGHITYYSLDGLTKFLTEMGFHVRSAERVNFLPPSYFYRKRISAALKNVIGRAVPNRYFSHLEVLCQK